MSDEEWDETKQRESVARWMLDHGFSTGHGDTIEDLLEELGWQIRELRDRLYMATERGKREP